MYILLAVAWYLIGVHAFIYWWTKDYDFELSIEVLIALFVGLFGPFTHIIGCGVHGKHKTIVLINKRGGAAESQ